MKLFVCIFDDPRLLPHFLRHYARFGITEFHIATPPDLARDVAQASDGFAVTQYQQFDVADSYTGGVSAVTGMRNLAQGPDEWVVIVDLDEFVEFGEPVEAIVAELELEGANVARGILWDRFPIDGRPKAFDDSSDLPSLYPVRARLTKNLMGGEDRKGVLVRGHLISRGAHHVFHDQRPSRRMFEISHYKWNDRSLDRVRLAYRMNEAAATGWAHEYKRVLDHYEEHGRFAWETFGGEVTR